MPHPIYVFFKNLPKVDFTAFAVSGDLLWDYEYFLRRGLGRVRVEPTRGEKVGSLPNIKYIQHQDA